MTNTLEGKSCIDIEELEERFRQGLITKFASEGFPETRLPFTEREIEILLPEIEAIVQMMNANGGNLPNIYKDLNIDLY